jgi:two-component system, cell cycle sensor histidine kinase and response regulator CckA
MRSQVLEPDPEKKRSHLAESVAETLLSPIFFEAVPDAMVAVNQSGEIVQINSQTERLFGYTQDELLGQRIEVLVPVGQRELHHQHRERFHHKPEMRRMGAQLDLRGRRKDGSEFPVEISLSPVPTDAGMVVLSAIRDITYRKRMEEQLRKAHEELAASKDRQLQESQSRLALIVDSSQDAIIGKNLDGTITHWNKGAEHIYGYTAGEVIGKPISILAPKDRPDEIHGILEKIRQGGRVEYFETVRVRKDGQRLNLSISVSPIRDAHGEVIGASAIARDVTNQKRAEELLRQAQKMEAVGRLAGGVAHDFNNVLGIVTACCELLRSRVEPNGVTQFIDNISEAAKRGASLTRQLLIFSRRQVGLQPRLLDLNDSLKEVVKLLRPLMGDDVQIIVRHGADTAVVESDPAQLDQIVLNIAVNARDAMPRGGKLILETLVQEFDAALAERHPPMKPGRYVLLAISDTGVGMDATTLSQIFEPFFTTKEIGKGTGLGLATVYGIVKQSGGHIWVYSEVGRGTTFKIYLPAADHKLEAAPAESQTLPPKAHGKTILLVEDDALMRSLTRQMLEEHGYAVIEAEDGKSALGKLSFPGISIDVVLTDVVMRGMSGPELALELIRHYPAVKVVYMSGYTGELIEQNGDSMHGMAMLDKPFTRAMLLKTIHEALRQGNSD